MPTEVLKESYELTAFGELTTASFMPLTGWAFTYNINPSIVKSSVLTTGTITNSLGHAVLSTGTSPTGLAKIETVRGSRYIPGVGGISRFTFVFDTPRENNKQVIGLINGTDGWGFGYDGLRFGIIRKNNGVENWIYQEDWNTDKKINLEPSKGNVYQIRYQWLGYGMQYFEIEDENGNLSLVHTIKYSNKNTETSILNPNLPLTAYVVNSGNIENVTVKTPSAVAGLHGDAFNDAISTNNAEDSEKTIEAGTLIPVLAFRMGDTYKGKANRLFAQILRIAFATELNKPGVFRVWSGGTVTGGSWVYLNEEITPLEANNTFTSYTIGNKIGTFPLSKIDSYSVPLTDSFFRLYAGQQIVITVGSAGIGDIVASMNWKTFV